MARAEPGKPEVRNRLQTGDLCSEAEESVEKVRPASSANVRTGVFVREVAFMFDPIHRHIMAGYAVSIEFTKQGWRQFARLNASLGTRYIRAFILKRDVAEYIAAHEAAGVKLDTGCQELRYDGGVHLLLRKVQGTWLITDVFCTEEAVAFVPVYFWTRIRRGCNLLLVRLITGWRSLTKALAERLVGA